MNPFDPVASPPQPPCTCMKSGAEAVLEALVAEGVTTIFGYPGGAIMPVYDALYHYTDRLQHILVRHEQGAIHAAQGYARASGRTGVVLATSGPGATNLVTGLADALADSTPLVCITGQVTSALLGTDAFQETDITGISLPVTKWNCRITRAADIPRLLAKAFFVARSGRPGPVLVDITKDAQFGSLGFQYEKCEQLRSYQPVPALDGQAIEAAAALINSACKPYLLIGQGILLSGAEDALKSFVEKAGLPVASTLLGLGAFPRDHPLYAGFLGMHGDYAANIQTNACDVLIAIGMRFDDRVTGDVARYARQARIIHVDIDAAELNKIVRADISIHADAKAALEALWPLVAQRSHTAWIQEFRDLKAVEEAALQEAINGSQRPDGLPSQEFDSGSQQPDGFSLREDNYGTLENFDGQGVEEITQGLEAGPHGMRMEAEKQDQTHAHALRVHMLSGRQDRTDALLMQEVVQCLSDVARSDTIIVTDVGQHQMITARHYRFNRPNSHITSGGLGTMGFALPAAIGAKFGAPDKKVIAIIGDGGFQMTLQELGVLLQSQVDIKIIILNNQYLGMVRQWQQLFFDKRYSFTSLVSPDFVALAKVYGIEGRKISQEQDLQPALVELVHHKGAYLLEIAVLKEENVFPMIETGASVSEVRLQ